MGGEWSLVAFTITGQLAAGLYLAVGVPVYFGLGDAAARLGRSGRLGFLTVVLVLLAVATALSIFHLHHPAKAYRTLANLGRSWLSREILSLLVFGAAAGALTVCEWAGIGGPTGPRALFILGGLGAVLLLVTMSRLYMLPAMPDWDRVHTPLSFLLTAAVLGAVAAAFAMSLPSGSPPQWRAVPQPLLAASVCGIVASLLNAALLAPVYGILGSKPGPSLRPPGPASSFLHVARLIALAVGAAIIVTVVVAGDGRGPSAGRVPAMLAAAFVLAAAGEVSGRFLFYGLSGRRN